MTVSRIHKRRSAREIRKQLRSIYEGSDGRVPDLSKLDRGEGNTITQWLLKIIGLLAIICAIAWGGFFVFTQTFFHTNETLSLSVEGPTEAKSGEKVSYTFRYENTGEVPVASLAMKLNLPNTFHLYSLVPEPSQPNEWTIGSLSAGSDGAITVTGVFLAEVSSSQRLQALFTYKPANFSSNFQDITTQKVEIIDSVVDLSLTGPEKALAGDVSEYVINIQNNGSDPIFNLRVTPRLPENFTLTQSQPILEEGQSYWPIPTLAPGDLMAITLKGTYTSTASGEQTLGADVGFVQDEIVYTQVMKEIITDVLGGMISFSVIINGSNQNQTADLGETLRVSIDYANNGTETIDDLGLTLTLLDNDKNIPIDWNLANLGGGTRTGNDIQWSDLGSIAPQESKVIDLGLPLLSKLNQTDTDTFTLSVTLSVNKIGSIFSTRTLEATPIKMTLNSDMVASVQARYFSEEGTVIGTGPLPTQVGQTTSYRMYWNLSNSLHTLETIRLSTTLPQDVTWLENTDTDIGTLNYNPTTRQITWTIPKLLAELEHAGAWFELAINPSDADVGHFVRLTNTTAVEATDTMTSEAIKKSLSEITTELPEDTFATGKGTVIKSK